LTPSEVLADRRAAYAERRQPPAEGAVAEVAIAEHLERVRPRGRLELRVEPERPEPSARPGEVHLAQERLLRLRRGPRRERRRDGEAREHDDEYESRDWAPQQPHRGTVLRPRRTVNPQKGDIECQKKRSSRPSGWAVQEILPSVASASFETMR